MSTLYAPGSTPVAVTPRGFAVFEHGASAALLARVRSVVADGRGLGGVIESLTGAYGASLTAIPSFAVALVEGDAMRIAVRGDFAFDIDADVPERVSGAGVTTWTERVVRGVRRVTLQSGAGDGTEPAELPVADGVVLASSNVWDAAATASAGSPDVASPEAVPGPEPVAAASAAPARTVPASAEPAPVAPAPVAPTVSAPAAPASAPVAGTPSAPVTGGVAAPAARRGAASTSRSPEQEPEPARNVAGLIDSSTVQTMAGDETLLPEDSELSQPRIQAPGGDPASATGYEPVWGATVIRPVEDAAVRPEAGGEAVPAAAPGDHDGATISLAQARALRAGRTAAPAEQAPSSTTPPLAPPRPPAPGRIRVSTGQVLLLDRTVVIGRRPRSTRVSGTDLPHLVAVDSPQQDISRSHVELRVEGESIVATDLRTTNGTTLLRAGSDPVRLHPGEATVVIPGDVLDLGDGIRVAIEGLA